MKITARQIFRIVFIIWVGVWLLFFVRGLVKGEWRDYKNLFGRGLEEKRAYVSGGEFYEFIIFCKDAIPEDSDYSVEADYDAAMDYYRFAYYIYPALRNLYDPEYIACYKTKFSKRGYRRLRSLERDKYILRKVKR